MSARPLAALALAFVAGCAHAMPAPPESVRIVATTPPSPIEAVPFDEPTTPPRQTRQVIVVTIDGVRWQEIFGGVDGALAAAHGLREAEVVGADALVPNLRALGARGAIVGAPGHGAPIVASGPNYASLPGYIEMLSGRPSSSCQRNDCPPTRETTLLDACREGSEKVTDVAMISSWETLERAAARDPEALVISAGRHHGENLDALRRDARLSPLLRASEKAFPSPGQEDYRPDRITSQLALRYVESARPRCLFVGLGDPDEHAHLGDYRSYLRSLRAADDFVGALASQLDGMGAYGETTSIVVTTDHGRAEGFRSHGKGAPEAARVWLFAGGGAIPARGFVDAAETRRLADVGPTAMALLGLRVDSESRDAGRPIAELLPSGPTQAASRTAALGTSD